LQQTLTTGKTFYTNLASVRSLAVIFLIFASTYSTLFSVSRAFSSSAWKFSTATAMIEDKIFDLTGIGQWRTSGGQTTQPFFGILGWEIQNKSMSMGYFLF
jgi:hypothetical protein